MPWVPDPGRYTAVLEIGRGGTAKVYAGIERLPFGSRRLVVIKQVREEIADDPDYHDMFIDECRIAMRLNHPNVVHTYDVFDDPQRYGLVMEFLDGQSLLEVLSRVGRDRVPLHDHLWILTQLLAGLEYVHQLADVNGQPLHLVHRDVSPSNVFVCQDGSVKLLDFGIAKAADAISATRSGVLKGKIGYVAPEQCLGYPAEARSDLYSVGVMLWEALARRRRLFSSVMAAQLNARIAGREPPIERLWPDVPEPLAAIARRALQVDPNERYQSAEEFRLDLERYLAQARRSASASSVAVLMKRNFSEERESLKRAIEAHIQSATRGDEADAAARYLLPRARDGAVERISGVRVRGNAYWATRARLILHDLAARTTALRGRALSALTGVRGTLSRWLALALPLMEACRVRVTDLPTRMARAQHVWSARVRAGVRPVVASARGLWAEFFRRVRWRDVAVVVTAALAGVGVAELCISKRSVAPRYVQVPIVEVHGELPQHAVQRPSAASLGRERVWVSESER